MNNVSIADNQYSELRMLRIQFAPWWWTTELKDSRMSFLARICSACASYLLNGEVSSWDPVWDSFGSRLFSSYNIVTQCVRRITPVVRFPTQRTRFKIISVRDWFFLWKFTVQISSSFKSMLLRAQAASSPYTRTIVITRTMS